MTPALRLAIEAARHRVMTADETEAQRISWAYGNAAIENPRITRQDVADAAERLREAPMTDLTRLREACSHSNDEICQTLGRALGYPRYCDDQENFPGSTDADGVCVGEHVAESLAGDAAEWIAMLEADRDKLQWLPEPPKHRDCYRGGYYYAIPKDRDTWLDGDIEVVYLGFNGKWSVMRVREMRHYAIDEFSHWYGPIARPELPPEVEAMLDAE